MRCAACESENPSGKKFCGDCGAVLENRCPQCGADNPASKRFCGDCGAVLVPTVDGGASARANPETSAPRSAATGPRASSPETRKVITVIFADLMGSTALQERLDPESVNRIMDAYYRAVRGPVEGDGGTVVQLLGDGVLCAFGVPTVAEDDALRAVRAAVGIQRAFRDFVRAQQWLSAPIGLRVAVNTGEVVVSDEHPAGIGDPLNVAARLQQEAQDGEVLIGDATRRLVAAAVTLERAGVFALKGRAEAVSAYRVVSLDRPAGVAAIPFVGRQEELRRLLAVYGAAVSERSARLAVVLGSPGLGKSRILEELGRQLADGATVLKASCDAAGGATFAPVAVALRDWLAAGGGSDRSDGPDDLRIDIEAAISATDAGTSAEGSPKAERARIAGGVAALLAGSPGPPEETFFVFRRFVTALSSTKPVLLILDDLQWAEPLLLDLVEHLVQWGQGVRLVVLVGARPELRTTRSALATQGPLVTEVITLAGLDAAAATQLAANAIGAGALPAAVAGRVLATSEGNPLFVCELARMLVNDGVLTFGGGQWTTEVDLSTLDIPPTIHAVLAARIERLRPEERTVLERAAVIGRQFSRTAVAHLLGETVDLDTCFEALRRGELVEPDTGWFLGEPTLRFHHVLIRDAAYRRVLKETRAQLHERFANWITDRVGAAVEHDETIGFHLEHAHQNRLELGPLDEHGRRLGERAAQMLGGAGRRALARDDVSLAAGLLGRALARLDPQDPARGELALDWCEALLAAGDVGPAVKAIDELGRFATSDGSDGSDTSDRSDRLRAWHACFAGQLAVLTDPQSLRATAAAVENAAETLAAAEDAAGEAKAHTIHALALSRLGEIGACEAALDRALAAARRVRDRRRANTVLAGAPLAALWGPSPVARASGRCLDVVRVLRITQGAPAVEAVALRCQAVLETLRGRADAARRMVASSRRMLEELGIAQQILEADVFGALIDLLEGDVDAAEPVLRRAYEGLRERGLAIDAARAAALLGRALLAQDRADDAEAVSHESESLAGDDLKAGIAWRGVRAEALARRGETREAVALARAAVEIAAGTDALLDHADARTSLAAALRADGCAAEAAAEERLALELWKAKGATLLVERARASTPSVELPSTDNPSEPAPRRVRPNAATAEVAQLDAAVMARDLGAVETHFADLVETIHHPLGATWNREGALDSFRSLLANASRDLSFRHEPLATLGESLALHRQRVAMSTVEGGEFDVGAVEVAQLFLVEVDERGRRVRSECFAIDRQGDGIVRLYARWAERAAPEERARAAIVARAVAASTSPNTDALAEVVAPDLVFEDRRRLGMGSARGAERYLRGLRSLLDAARDLVNEDEVLMASPEALLLRRRGRGTLRESGGDFEHHMLLLWIYGADGHITHIEMFDPECESEALERLEALTASSAEPTGNAAWRALLASNQAWHERRWEDVVTSFHPGYTLNDRRRVTGIDLAGTDFVRNLRMMFDMPGSEWHVKLIATGGENLILVRSLLTADFPGSGRTEWEHLTIAEYDPQGRRVAMVVFDTDDLDAAQAELEARSSANMPISVEDDALRQWLHPNAAIVAHDRLTAAFAARDWETMRARFAPDARIEERRALLRTPAIDADTAIEAMRAGVVGFPPDLSSERRTHSLYGDRVALERQLWFGGPAGAGFEMEMLSLVESDAEGRVRALITFDPDDLVAASREATERWIVIEPALAPLLRTSAAYFDALRAHDGAHAREVFADDIVVEDHRRTGFGRLDGAEAFLATIRAGWQLTQTSFTNMRVRLAIEPWGSVAICHVRGTLLDGGFFENLWCALVVVEAGLFRRCEFFEVDAAERALGRFEELRAERERSSDPLLIPPNTAVRAIQRVRDLALAEDWEGIREHCSPAYRFEDRRPLLRSEGDRDLLVANSRHIGRSVWEHTSRALLATSGDRLCLHSIRFKRDRDGAHFIIESLEITEVDEAGRLLAGVIFDVDDRRAAAGEMMERYMHGEGAQRMPASQIAFLHALHAHDVAGMRAALERDGFVFIDHRRTGLGELHDLDEYIASVEALHEQAEDATIDVLYHVAVADHGSLSVGRTFGTLRGGGPFESVFVRLNRYEDGRNLGAELFEIDELDRAKARFDELGREYAARRPPP